MNNVILLSHNLVVDDIASVGPKRVKKIRHHQRRVSKLRHVPQLRTGGGRENMFCTPRKQSASVG